MDDTPVQATQKYIDCIQCPASRDEVLSALESNGAPDDVLEAARDDQRERFTGPNELHHVLWKAA